MTVFRRQRPGWDFRTAVRGEGAYLWDEKGRRMLDAAGGAIVVSVGHGVVEIAEAIANQARRLAYVHGSELTSEPIEALAVEMAKRAPVDDARLFLVSGGSEAMETAIKLARQYHVARGDRERWKIGSRWPSYHGASLGALAVSGRPTLRRDFEPFPAPMPHNGAPYPYRCALSGCGTVAASSAHASSTRRCARRSRHGRRLHRRAGHRRLRRRRRAAARLLRDGARDLRSPRRALHRRRGG